MKFSRLFLPHPKTHEKAHLLSFKALAVYILFFFALEFFIRGGSLAQANVLGAAFDITQGQIVQLTNVEREKLGLGDLKEDPRLDAAAAAKAQNMFAENYWAHYSPSGKDPWGFIEGAGYKFSYAGENLARNFSHSPEVVSAWMASPTHRDNIVNSHYTDIGIAVAEGKINGQDTVLVVQEFGRPSENFLAKAPSTSEPTSVPAVPAASLEPLVNPIPTVQPVTQPAAVPVVAGDQAITPQPQFVWQSASVFKTAGLSIVGFLFALIVLDLIVIRKRSIYRLSASHMPHLALLSVTGSVLWNTHAGQISEVAAKIITGS